MTQKTEEPLLVSRGLAKYAFLPEIGRFCKCGCNRRIEGVMVTKTFRKGQIIKTRSGTYTFMRDKTITFRRKASENKVFASDGCKQKFYNANGKKRSTTDLMCRLRLPVLYDKGPYRSLVIYLLPQIKEEIRITPDMKPLWAYLEKLASYRVKKPVPLPKIR